MTPWRCQTLCLAAAQSGATALVGAPAVNTLLLSQRVLHYFCVSYSAHPALYQYCQCSQLSYQVQHVSCYLLVVNCLHGHSSGLL